MKFTKSYPNNELSDVIDDILSRLNKKGYSIESGLNDKEIKAVEDAFKSSLPTDLEIFLRAGIVRNAPAPNNPRIITNDYYPDWRSPIQEARKTQEFISRIFSFDIENNDYWNLQFGEKPMDTQEAIKQALKIVYTWPVLYPLHAHHFMSSSIKIGGPVLSVSQPSDTVYISDNLLSYLNKDFKLNFHVNSEERKVIPNWSEAFNL